jgi:hypothetical protein
MRCVLGQHDDMGGKEWAIYYLSKTLSIKLFFKPEKSQARSGLVNHLNLA